MASKTQWSLRTFALGFLVEAATEAYQFESTGGAEKAAWIGFYYVGLVTTAVGFYLIYLGRREWTDLHRKRVRQGHRCLGFGLMMFLGAALALAILAKVLGSSNAGGTPDWAVAVVGGLVALSLGTFFLGLVQIVLELAGPVGRALAWGGFAWSLGVAVLTGLAVGERIRSLLGEFLSNPLGLVVGFAPLAFVLSPLFVAYALFAYAYLDADHRLASLARSPKATG